MQLNPADHGFLETLCAALPAHLFRQAEPRHLEEPRGRWAGQAAIVAMPETTEQVSAVIAAAHRSRVRRLRRPQQQRPAQRPGARRPRAQRRRRRSRPKRQRAAGEEGDAAGVAHRNAQFRGRGGQTAKANQSSRARGAKSNPKSSACGWAVKPVKPVKSPQHGVLHACKRL